MNNRSVFMRTRITIVVIFSDRKKYQFAVKQFAFASDNANAEVRFPVARALR